MDWSPRRSFYWLIDDWPWLLYRTTSIASGRLPQEVYDVRLECDGTPIAHDGCTVMINKPVHQFIHGTQISIDQRNRQPDV